MTVDDPSLSSSGLRRSALSTKLMPWDVSRGRIARLQKLCRELKLGGLLFIPGVDGRSNWGSQTFLNWALLGKTGRALAGEPYIESEYDALEDSVILVTPKGFSIFYNHEVSGLLEPVLAHMLGVREYRTSQAELEDSDLFEKRKILSFLHMLDHAMEPGQRRIGIPFPLGFDDAKDLESWPLIQAYALDEMGRRGFFSARYECQDITPMLQSLLTSVDAAFVDTVVAEGIQTLRHHMRTTLSVADGGDLSWSSRAPLTEEDLSEPLLTLHEFGHVRDSPSAHASAAARAPRVLLGPRTSLLSDASTGPCPSSTVEGAFHMVVEGGDPTSSLRFCRTYFLRSNALPSAPMREASLLPGQAPPPAEEGTVNSTQAHASRFHAAYRRLVTVLSTLPTLTVALHELRAHLVKLLADGPWESVDVAIEATDAAGVPMSPDAPIFGVCLVYVRLLAGLGHEGAVAVGDTALYRPSALLGNAYTTLTQAHALPYFHAWAGPGAEDFYATRLARSLLDGHLANEMGLGQAVGPLFNHCVALLPSEAYPLLDCQLRLFESGLALLRTGRFPLIIPMHEGVEDLQLCEPSSASPTTVLQLRLRQPLCGALPFTPADAQPTALALVLPSPGSSLSHTLLPLLPSWRLLVEQRNGTPPAHEGPPLLPLLDTAFQAYGAQRQTGRPLPLSVEAMYAQELADALADCWTPAGPSPDTAGQSVAVTLLLGLPGSGVLEVGSQVMRFASKDQGWAYTPITLLAPAANAPTPSDPLGPITAALTSAVQGQARRVLLAVVGDMVSLPAVCLLVLQQPGLRLSGACVVMSLARLVSPNCTGAADADCWLPGLWDQAMEGWCTSLLLVDGGNNEADADKGRRLRQRFRRANRHAPILQVSHNCVEAEALAEVLKDDSFSSLHAARTHALGPHWEALRPSALCPPLIAEPVGARVTLLPEGPLDVTRLVACLRSFFPHAALPTDDDDSKASAPVGQAVLQEGRDELERGLKEWAAERRALMPEAECQSVYGVFLEARTSQPFLLDASSRHVSLTPAPSASDKARAAPALQFLGFGLRPASLTTLLKLALPYVRKAKPLRSRESLSQDEVASLCRKAEQDGKPVPEGWWYDGHSYLDGFGTRLYHRPDLEELAAHYLDKVNAQIEQDNAAMRQPTL